MLDIFETLAKLASVHSPAGFETPIAEVIAELATPYADEVKIDTLGNLIVYRKANADQNGSYKPKKVMVSAHMDSIGMIVTHVDDNGYIRFANIGGLSPVVLLNVPVKFANGTRGVIAKEDKAELKNLAINDLYIDIGASTKEEAIKKVNVGDVAVYSSETYLVGESRIVSPYLDDRIACVVLLMVLESIREIKNDLYFVFSAQEEVGIRGAKTAAFSIEPDVGLAVDVTSTGDIPEMKVPMNCSLGKGAAIKVMDASVICSPKVVRILEQMAKDFDIKHQFEILQRGGTDAGSIQLSRTGAHTGAVSIPTRYVHSPQEMCDLEDVKAAAALVGLFVANELEL
jgi:putative aminopeptidase FrvX